MVLNMNREDCYKATFYLSDAYYNVPHWLYLTKHTHFSFFACLPNSLSLAPKIFAKLLKPVISALHR